MSGLELAGVAASILQIADLGAQLSIKLVTFCHKVKNADESIQTLSNDVALTSNVLRHLGDNLEQDRKQDRKGGLYSNDALGTANDVLEECRRVFEQIGSAIDDPGKDKDSAKGLFQRAAKRVGFVVMEPQLDALRGNLERLKSTMLLMLNVIMYAGQLRGQSESSVLQEQRELIQSLMEEKRLNDKRFRQFTSALESSSFSDDETLPGDREPPVASPSINITSGPSENSTELSEYCKLIAKMLSDIDNCKSDLESARHDRMATGVLGMHAVEARHFELSHGPKTVQWIRNRVSSLYDQAGLVLPEYADSESDAEEYSRDGYTHYRQHRRPYQRALKKSYGERDYSDPSSVIAGSGEQADEKPYRRRMKASKSERSWKLEEDPESELADMKINDRIRDYDTETYRRKGRASFERRRSFSRNSPSTRIYFDQSQYRDDRTFEVIETVDSVPQAEIVHDRTGTEQLSAPRRRTRSPSPVSSEGAARQELADTIILDRGAEPAQPAEPVDQDDMAQPPDIESLMLEWTTLGKEEVSSSGPRHGFPVH